jgi:type I pantothenate kinase
MSRCDAEETDIEAWYVERFLILQRTAFQNPASYFHHYRELPLEEARKVARGIWREINLANLRENILPTCTRADVVLRKHYDIVFEERQVVRQPDVLVFEGLNG